MIEITINIDKKEVYNRVAQQTSYIGIKKDDETSYDKIFTSDEDRSMLEKFFNQASAIATNLFKPFMTEYSYPEESVGIDLERGYMVVLDMPETFDPNLQMTMQDSLQLFYVSFIMTQWLRMADKDSAAEYAEEADGQLADVKSKLYSRIRRARR